MVRKLALRGTAGLIAGALATVGLVGPSEANEAVPLGKAGGLIGWGKAVNSTAFTIPADLQDVAITDIATGNGWSVILTANGKVRVLGTAAASGADIEVVPEQLSTTKVKEVVASAKNAAAITSDGHVAVWGEKLADDPDPTDVPAALSDVVSLAITNYAAAAVKSDGSVVTWGLPGTFGETVPPAEATNLTSVVGGPSFFLALKRNGTVENPNRTVVAWGNPNQGATTLPAILTDTTDSVEPVALAGRSNGGMALMSNGTIVNWGQNSATSNAVPAELAGKTIVSISAQPSNNNVAAASDGTVAVWGLGAGSELKVYPAALAGSSIASIGISGSHVMALVSKVLPVDKPTITGNPKITQTLTATPAAFSGGPDSVTGQWLANGTDIAGATGTTLVITGDLLGKQISYVSSAVKGAATPVHSESAKTAAVTPNIVASTTNVSAPTRAYGTAGTATVTISSSAAVAGTVTLSGAGATQTKPVSAGKAVFSLPRTLAPKAYTLTAKYNGSSAVSASTKTARYTVVKGKVRSVTFKASKAPTSKKAGKATVTVTAPSGLAKATGKVTVSVKGKTKKTIKATLSGGKRAITLPKLKKGSYKITVTYAGDSKYTSAKSKTYSLKIKK